MNNELIVYQSQEIKQNIEVLVDNDTVWLNRNQLADLFDRDVKTIGKHINNVFREGELDKNSVVAKIATTAQDGKIYQIENYNLDVIISVGYRVKSKQGTNFRIWATKLLKEQLIKNINPKEINDEKFKQIVNVISIAFNTVSSNLIETSEAIGILKILNEYAYALEILDKYDHQKLEIDALSNKETIKLTYEDAIEVLNNWKNHQNAGDLFGKEKDESFKSSLNSIYQTINNKEVYPTIEEKAANLLYFIVKNHSFADGNKRIAAGLFAYFLHLNNSLLKPSGVKRIEDNALVAITIMIAESKSNEKDIMVKLVVNLIQA